MYEMERWIGALEEARDGPFTTYRSLLYRSLTPIVAFHAIRVSLPKLYCRKVDFHAYLADLLLLVTFDSLMGELQEHGSIRSFMKRLHRYSSDAFVKELSPSSRPFSTFLRICLPDLDAATSARKCTPLRY